MANKRSHSTGQYTTLDAIYLQPHSDDICFSLGARAARCHSGLMVTIFSLANWVERRAIPIRPSPEEVTKLRIAEDRAFAEDAGLDVYFMGLPGASNLGWKSFDLSRLADNRKRVEAPLLAELDRLSQVGENGERPWLFCPAGIGRHVDHVAVRNVVADHRDQLSQHFRIAYYEDLHYSSRHRVRIIGLARLFVCAGDALRRWAFVLDRADVEKKRQLISHYASQIKTPTTNLRSYSPAVNFSYVPHEAIWTTEEPPADFREPPQQFDSGAFFGRLSQRLLLKQNIKMGEL